MSEILKCPRCGSPVSSAGWLVGTKTVCMTFRCGAHTLPCGDVTVDVQCLRNQLSQHKDEINGLKASIAAVTKEKDQYRDEAEASSELVDECEKRFCKLFEEADNIRKERDKANTMLDEISRECSLGAHPDWTDNRRLLEMGVILAKRNESEGK